LPTAPKYGIKPFLKPFRIYLSFVEVIVRVAFAPCLSKVREERDGATTGYPAIGSFDRNSDTTNFVFRIEELLQ